MIIIFEGMDLAGKGTQVALLKKKLEEEKIPHSVFREPGGTPSAERIRELAISSNRPQSPASRALLFIAARKELYQEKVIPAIQRGELVILDRSYPSTFAYSPEEDWDWIYNVHEGLGLFDRQHKICFFDIDHATHIERIKERISKDAIEKELTSSQVFNLYRERYLTLFDIQKTNGTVRDVEVISGTGSIADISMKVLDFTFGEEHDYQRYTRF